MQLMQSIKSTLTIKSPQSKQAMQSTQSLPTPGYGPYEVQAALSLGMTPLVDVGLQAETPATVANLPNSRIPAKARKSRGTHRPTDASGFVVRRLVEYDVVRFQIRQGSKGVFLCTVGSSNRSFRSEQDAEQACSFALELFKAGKSKDFVEAFKLQLIQGTPQSVDGKLYSL